MRPVGQVRRKGGGARVFSACGAAFLCALACNQLWGIEEPYDLSDAAPASSGPATSLDGNPPPVVEAAAPPGDAVPPDAREGGRGSPDAPHDAHPDVLADGNVSGPCEGGAPICVPGSVDPGSEKCGDCNLGTRTRSRTCAPDGCSWSEWTAWSDCAGSTAECPAGKVEPDSQNCGWCNLGTQSRSRTCGQDCKWGPWSGFGTCAQGGECEGGTFRCCGGGGKWEWCYVSSCKWTRDCAACTNCGC